MALSKVRPGVRQAHATRFGGGFDRVSEASWAPNTDVYVKDDGLVIKMELAGMRSEELELRADGSRLIISGTRPDERRPDFCKFQIMEISYGTFERIIEVPAEYDLREAKAAYQNGFLRIDVPVRPRRKPRRDIAVTVLEEGR